jgi:hypothetical protein
VEPKAASHVFVVHGQACLHSPAHPTCTHTKEGVKPAGKSYVVDLKPILGSDWRVLLQSLHLLCMHQRAEFCMHAKYQSCVLMRKVPGCLPISAWPVQEGGKPLTDAARLWA